MTSRHDADLYADLGLTREASRAEITRAYRALLREHHPDTRPHPHRPGPNLAPSYSAPAASASSSDEALNRALAAYAVLADPDRRANYARQQRDHRGGGEQQTPPPAVYPTHPTRPAALPLWPAGIAPVGSLWEAAPPIRVGPVRWHRVSPATGRRP